MWGGGDPAHFGDAIRLTDPSVFLSTNHPTRCVRIVYEVLQTGGEERPGAVLARRDRRAGSGFGGGFAGRWSGFGDGIAERGAASAAGLRGGAGGCFGGGRIGVRAPE